MNNPYTFRGPIRNQKFFFGRKKDIEHIFSFLSNEQPQSCSIIGERRIGKTSLLLHIRKREVYSNYLKDPFVFVFFDFQKALRKSREYFFEETIKEILRQIKENIQINAKENANFEGFEKLLSELKKLGYKLVFLFDEMESVNGNSSFDEEFFSSLRSLVNSYDIAYITASQKSLADLCLSKEILSSPFFNVFQQCWLGLLDEEEALSLILEPARHNGMIFNKEKDLPFIVKIAGNHPFFIQIACYYLFEKKKNLGMLSGEQLKEKDFDEIVELVARDLKEHFGYIWGHLNNEDRSCIREIIYKDESIPNKESIKSLLTKGILIHEGQFLRVFSVLFEDFIKSIPIVIEEETDIGNNKNNKIPNRLVQNMVLFVRKIEENLFYKLLVIISVILGIVCAIITLL